MRIAAILVPLFPLAARLRSEPELAQEAVVLVEGNGSSAHVIAATKRARKSGVKGGMSLPQSRSILPRVIARGRDAECERAAQEALFELAEMFSPRVENHGDGIVFVDIDGIDRHYPGEDPEKQIASAIIRRATSVNLPVRVGIASSKLAARVAAELPQTPNIIRPGEEEKFLAPLPLTRLSPELGAAMTFHRWGIDSIGELARLSESEVASRLGEIGRELHYAARGIDPRPLIPRQPPPDFREGMDLEWPIVSVEPFLFVANAALERLATRLETQGYACTRLDVSMRLEPEGFHDRAIELPAPTRDVKTLLSLIRLELEANPPGAPVAGFTLIAHPDQPRQGQLSLFGPAALSHDKLTTTIARIASMIGNDRIGMAETINEHAPERYGISTFDPPPPPRVRRTPRKGRGLLAVRVLRPAIPLDVRCEEKHFNGGRAHSPSLLPDLANLQLRAVAPLVEAKEDSKQKPLNIRGSVRVAAGPWRVEQSWWADSPVDRDYWDVELTTGGIFRIFRERGSGDWFADGMYD
jgi:protein ImuB